MLDIGLKELLKKLHNIALTVQALFPSFYLAGGTAIALKHMHRKSTDLDFFNFKPFSKARIVQKLKKQFKVQGFEVFEDNVDVFVKNTKLSFVHFPFKNIKRIENIKGIRIASDYDLFLNKLYAAGRRIDPKDPYDVAYLYKKHRWSVKSIKKDFEKKFINQSFEIYLGALLSFDDYGKLPLWVKKQLKEIEKQVKI